MKKTMPTFVRCSALICVLSLALGIGISSCATSASAPTMQSVAPGAEERAVRAAREAQNRAIASGDVERITSYWTEDVEIRRGLGALAVGRDAYRKLFIETGFDSAVVYQREPSTVTISSAWPLAYESGTWAGHLGSATGPVVIGGSYAAQWVKREGHWLIRGEVFVALECAGRGCAYAAAL
jgi:ketosteroid isomerase-like protein